MAIGCDPALASELAGCLQNAHGAALHASGKSEPAVPAKQTLLGLPPGPAAKGGDSNPSTDIPPPTEQPKKKAKTPKPQACVLFICSGVQCFT